MKIVFILEIFYFFVILWKTLEKKNYYFYSLIIRLQETLTK